MRQISDRAAFIRELRSRVHADTSAGSLRDDLLLLAGDDAPADLTSDDILDLLEGNTTLNV